MQYGCLREGRRVVKDHKSGSVCLAMFGKAPAVRSIRLLLPGQVAAAFLGRIAPMVEQRSEAPPVPVRVRLLPQKMQQHCLRSAFLYDALVHAGVCRSD